MSAIDADPFPRGALIAAGSLVIFSLVATTAVRIAKLNAPPAPGAASVAPPLQSIDLWFVDKANGAVSVRDQGGAHQIAVLEPGTNGFIRGVMRGLAHDRVRRGIGAAPPFRLSKWTAGRLTLDDTATGRQIDLNSFGVQNTGAFAQLLNEARDPS
jgi:putative photosynthetic complex assembly protein